MDQLSTKALNRATLSRQFLLEGTDRTVEHVVEHLVGMQAQNPLDPYFGLWARVEDFDPELLAEMTAEGDVVRAAFMRATIHLFTSRDALQVHPLTRDVLQRVFRSTQFAKDTADVNLDVMLNTARSLLEKQPRTRAELARELGSKWPDHVAGSLAQAATYLLPVLQTPPRGVWGETGQATWALFEPFVGKPYGPAMAVDDFALRYLGAFGPAAVKDMRVWSGLTGLREVFERLRPRLRIYRDENGTELFDLADIDLPDPDTPAPPRLLPEYDNVLLGHADRSRFFVDDAFPRGWVGNVLIDGVFGGSWKRQGPVLELSVTERGLAAEDELHAEAQRLISLAWPEEVDQIHIGSL